MRREQSRSVTICTIGALALLPLMVVCAQDLADGRALWNAAATSDYEYSYQRTCECHPETPADTIVTVRRGEITAVRYARDDYAEDIPVAADRLRWFRTVDDMFGLLESALAREAVVRATFDPELGYPVTIYIDYLPDLVGDEVELRITSFRALIEG